MATVKTWVTGESVDADDLNENFSKIIATQTYTAGEALSENDSVYVHTDGKVYKADADNAVHMQNWIGFACSSAILNASVEVQTVGKRTGFAGLTTGSTYYASNTAGAISTSLGTVVREVGMAVSSTALFIYPRAATRLSRFGCKVYQNSGTSIGGGHSIIAFQVEAWDDDSMHDNVTNNSRITFNTAGYYLVTASMYTDGTSTSGAMGGRIMLNGSTVIGGGGGLPYTAGVSISLIRAFSVGDYIEFSCISPPTTVGTSGNEATNFCVQLIQKT